ncbi:MAG: PA14 domain-containing protein, partial [Terracidiphilus sp.]
REVVVEVVATDEHNRPVSDLTETDFQIFEVANHSPKSPRSISAFHVVDPSLAGDHVEAASGGFRVTSGGGCAMSATLHYELAYQPSSDGSTSGYHEILVATTRPHVRLSFRRRYFVGMTGVPAKPKLRNSTEVDDELKQAACRHPPTPPSIALNAHLIQTASTDPLRYSLVVQPDSLAFTSISDEARRVQLDYGVCSFDEEGKPLRFWHTSAERVLSSEEYTQVLAGGFSNLVDMPRSGDPALVRFVVLDRETGNLGSIDVATAPAEPVELSIGSKAPRDWESKQSEADRAKLLSFNVGSFGSILPKPKSLCGDVYELPKGTRMLPSDFWNYGNNIDAVGAIYAYSLNVPYQFLTEGIPGVTSRPEWFGIDYHGEFWVEMPGEYRFKLSSDDGAELFIDDKQLINEDGVHPPLTGERSIQLTAGRHTIHVPYFQETMHVALILQVKPPGEDFKVFDTRDLGPPAEAR